MCLDAKYTNNVNIHATYRSYKKLEKLNLRLSVDFSKVSNSYDYIVGIDKNTILAYDSFLSTAVKAEIFKSILRRASPFHVRFVTRHYILTTTVVYEEII